MNLWGNKCDLSLSLGTVTNTADHISSINDLDSKILSDDSEGIWRIVSDVTNKSQIIGKFI